MMISDADFDELFPSQAHFTRQADTAGAVTDARVIVPALSTLESAQTNAALSTLLTAAVTGATWSLLTTMSRMAEV